MSLAFVQANRDGHLVLRAHIGVAGWRIFCNDARVLEWPANQDIYLTSLLIIVTVSLEDASIFR